VGEAAPELEVRRRQGGLGVEIDLARQVGEGEEEVADLLGDLGALPPAEGFMQLCDLLVDLVKDGARVGPVEADAGRLLGQAVGGQEGRQGAIRAPLRA
jgi:hypothetical protein